MSESISWSLTAGGSINAAGTLGCEATVTVSLILDAAQQNARDLVLQIDDVSKVQFLSISSSLSDATIKVTPKDGTEMALTGPVLLFGDAVKLFADDLGTLSVQNTSPDKNCEFTVLVGMVL